MPAPEHTSKGENLAVRFVNELTKEMAENEVVLAIGGGLLGHRKWTGGTNV